VMEREVTQLIFPMETRATTHRRRQTTREENRNYIRASQMTMKIINLMMMMVWMKRMNRGDYKMNLEMIDLQVRMKTALRLHHIRSLLALSIKKSCTHYRKS